MDPENTKTVSQEKEKEKNELQSKRSEQVIIVRSNCRIQFANAVTCENIKETLHIRWAQLEEKARANGCKRHIRHVALPDGPYMTNKF